MKTKKANLLLSAVLMLAFGLSACGLSFAQPTFTPAPTDTPQPTATITLTPTNTPKPSPTPRPTKTPNLAATERFEGYNVDTQAYFDKGYLKTIDGKITEVDDFNQDWAQLGWYKRWQLNTKASDFYMSAHFKWSSAYRNADISGCGFVFATQENGDHFAVFLDRAIIRFINADQSTSTRRMGVTRGTGRVNFNNPADQPVEADFTLIVKEAYAYVIVNGEVVGEYTLPQSRVLTGNLGLTLRSGTNKDYGTRCEMTNIRIWTPNE